MARKPMGDDLDHLSGPWKGYYTYHYSTAKHKMDLTLNFKGGRITGDGIDDIARFVLTGRYNVDKNECYWTKKYIGLHSVFYKGFIDGRRIWGLWWIDQWQGGGFLIVPKGLGEAAEEKVKEEKVVEEEVPAKALILHRRANPRRPDTGPKR
jgi:hypothetical protein